ncbi:hypothetical protein D3C72_1622590 [compost metagenome]
MALAGVRRVLVGPEQIARSGKPKPASRAGADHYGLGLDHVEVEGAAVETHQPRDLTIGPRQQPRDDHAVRHLDACLLQLSVEDSLHVVPLRHRQHIAADVVHLADSEVAGLVLFELDAPPVQFLDHREAVRGVGVHALLVDDAVVGDSDFLDVLLRRGVTGNHGVVQAIHAHRDRAAALHVGLVDDQHAKLEVLLFCLHRGHRPAGAATNNNDVVVQFNGVHMCSNFRGKG